MFSEEDLKVGFELGDWEVLPAKGILQRGDDVQRPEPKVFGVLMALARRDGDLVSRDELIDELWDGRPTSDEPINRCLAQLRGHLGDKSQPRQYIETLTRRGYRLMKPVRLKKSRQDDGRTEAPAARGQAPSWPRRWRLAAGIAALVVFGWLIWWQQPKPEFESIGVLPFENISQDPQDRYIVSGFKEELIQTLHNIPGFVVKNARVSYESMEIPEIAESLDVDSILVGKVTRSQETLKINYVVSRSTDGVAISSGSVTGKLEDIFDLQEELAVMVRDDLFGPEEKKTVATSRPASFEAYDRYMRGLYSFDNRQVGDNLERAIALFQETLRLDPEFGPAYLSLATAYALLPDYRGAPLANHTLAMETVRGGVAVDSRIEDSANAIYGFVYHKQKQWQRSEEAYMQATAAQVVDANAFNWYSRMLASVGRLDDSLAQARVALRLDPTSAVINSRVALSYTWLGHSAMADEFFRRSNELGAAGTTYLLGYALFLYGEGRTEEAYRAVIEAARSEDTPTAWVDPVFAALQDPALHAQGIEAIDAAADAGQINPQIELIVRTLFGDLDGAMRVARLLEEPGEAFEMDLLFIDELKPLREHPEFMELMDELGIAQYWRDEGCQLIDGNVRC